MFPEPQFTSALKEISDLKAALAAGREREVRYRMLFEQAPDGIAITDSRNNFVDANSNLCRMLGYARGELVGRPAASVGIEREVPRRGGAGDGPEGNSVCLQEWQLRRKDGSVFEAESSAAIMPDGNLLRIIRDVTGRKKGEEALREVQRVLERRVAQRTAELEAANKELEAFSYSVSHDLRAPLRAVDGFSQAMLEDFGGELPPEGRHQLQTIRDGAQRMGTLIDDLLTFARLSRQELIKRTVETGDLVRAALDELGFPWPGREVELHRGDLPASSGDPALLKQVWLNLLSNALKYTGKREKAVIEIGCAPTRGTDTYFVRDNGTGFDMRYAEKLFGVFQRLHRAEDYEGTGVGLAIVQRIVHRHGGRVWADAAVDYGATFYFTLEK